MLNRENAILELTGKPGNASYGVVAPSFWGLTKLQLQPTRLVESTQKIIARRNCTVLLTQIDSVEIVEEGNPMWIFLGFLTISFLVGIVFFVLYFVIKHKYLLIRSGSNCQLVMLDSTNESKADQFMSALLKQVEELQPNNARE
jgi:hypothetical protein